jgi:2-polyprenyl-3-methyl-5-hydroxy-6-metoxy-1,4-benzoquinol methylase
METKWIPCDACGADRFEPLSTVGEWTIGKCGDCGLVFVNPAPFFEPTDEFSGISRAFEYTEYMHRPVTDAVLAFEREQLLANAGEVARWSKGRSATPGRLRFLDIGCGSGASVRAATDIGWDATGIDIDPQLVQEGRERLKVDVRCVPVLECGLPDGTFDFIKLRDVVEHLPNPLEVLVKVRELLAPNGTLLIITPNEGGLPTRARVILRRRRTMVATVPPPHHLHSFNPDTLLRTMRRAGLRPLATVTTTPTDPRYVTSNNMARAGGRALLRPLWRTGKALGMGSVLVVWAQPQ